MKKAYVFSIYPTKNQEVTMVKTLNTCRHLYNDALAERKRRIELNRLRQTLQVFPWGKPEWIYYEDQANTLAACKDSFQKEVHSQILQNVLKRVNKSIDNFFRGSGFPRFKGMNRYDSFTYPQSGATIESGKLNLSKIGTIRIILHRNIKGNIKTCTIKRDVDRWYAIFTVEMNKAVEKVPVVTMVGIDVGLTDLLTLNTGEMVKPPKFLRQSENKLAKEQRRLAKKKLRSNNRKKQKLTVAKIHQKIRNQRKDFAHKTARTLVTRFDLIAFENLQIKNMVQNHHLAKSIMDAGWYQLQTLTASKAEEAGKQVKLCIAAGTSQTCHVCGNKQKMTLRDRVFRCNQCGNVENRDTNAANVVLDRCTAGTAGIEACKSGLSIDMMKQEATLLVGW
ncbi:MAG: transposase [Candidatus Ratteibacteria bacterium]|nr:transposase [Candidatus Ratteibacteria bacterium]